MQIVATNIANPKTITWKGRKEQTGIYKYPVNEPIFLGTKDVTGDHVMDRKYHGGIDRSCYVYAKDHYKFWQEKYPNLEWDYGMFGENITIQGFDEHAISIGAIYDVGDATVQVSTPRQPCYKLGIRFGDQGIIKQFVDSLFSGVYLRILKPGTVAVGQEFVVKDANENGIRIAELNTLMFHYDASKNYDLLKKAINDPLLLEEDKKKYLRKHL